MATPFDRVKAAWNSPDCGGELNRAVETMAAEGVGRAELYAALARVLGEVRAAGADEVTEDIILDVCDRLYGWCAPEWHITTRTSPNPREPDVAPPPAETV